MRLYPQYQVVSDRRKKNVPVAFERRSGVERRSENRIAMDTKLTRDIFEVKNKISHLQKTNPVNFSQDISNAATNSIKTDQFVKSDFSKTANKIAESKESPSTTAMLGGILGIALAGVVASSLMGPAGAVVAIGFGAYLGGKVLKQMVVSHMVDIEKNKRG